MKIEQRLPFLKILFKYTAKINPKTKYYKHQWIQSKDFRDLCNQGGLFCETFGYIVIKKKIYRERDAYLAFLLSMMT